MEKRKRPPLPATASPQEKEVFQLLNYDSIEELRKRLSLKIQAFVMD